MQNLFRAVHGYNTRIARQVPHQEWHKPYGVGQGDDDVLMDSGASSADPQESELSGAASHAGGSVSQPLSQAESSSGDKKKADTETNATSAQAGPGDDAV